MKYDTVPALKTPGVLYLTFTSRKLWDGAPLVIQRLYAPCNKTAPHKGGFHLKIPILNAPEGC